jgi:hypothetical protein
MQPIRVLASTPLERLFVLALNCFCPWTEPSF